MEVLQLQTQIVYPNIAMENGIVTPSRTEYAMEFF